MLNRSYLTPWPCLCVLLHRYDVVAGFTSVCLPSSDGPDDAWFSVEAQRAWVSISARTTYIRHQNGQGSPMWPHIPFNMLVALDMVANGSFRPLAARLKPLPTAKGQPMEGTLRSHRNAARISWNRELLAVATALSRSETFAVSTAMAYVLCMVCSAGAVQLT